MKGNRLAVVSLFVLVGLAVVTGCSRLGWERKTPKEVPQVGEQARYYHFQDVLIPHELKLEMDKSFIYETTSVKAGRLVFSGRVEVYSLSNFFTNNMEKDGWRLVNKFGFKDVVLNFTKPDKNCTVNIYDRPINTIVEVWVGPVGGGG
ncbi:MAG: hypothetical protein ACETWT_12345 [Thermodesulfobacteriota bacterium]